MGTILGILLSLLSWWIVYVNEKMSDEWAGKRLPVYIGVSTLFSSFAGDNAIRKFCIGLIPAAGKWAYDKCYIGFATAGQRDRNDRAQGEPLIGVSYFIIVFPPCLLYLLLASLLVVFLAVCWCFFCCIVGCPACFWSHYGIAPIIYLRCPSSNINRL